MKLTAYGAAKTVTGSKYLLESKGVRLLVDCGFFQGPLELEKKNWQDPPLRPSSLDAILLTHAHLDHCGYLPRLIKNGFDGPIFATSPTQDLAKIILTDACNLQQSEIKKLNKNIKKQKNKLQPLYNEHHVNRVSRLFRTIRFGESIEVKGIKITFSSAGHILGATSVHIDNGEKSIVFSGDLGRYDDPLIPPPDQRPPCDYLVLESTYGNRIHQKVNALELLKELVLKIKDNNSTLVIAAFAVSRMQLLQKIFYDLFSLHPELEIPLVCDSPMAEKVIPLYPKYLDFHRLSLKECQEALVQTRFLHFPKEEESFFKKQGPSIILSASGMLSGGRIVDVLQNYAQDKNNILALAGYQAVDSPGREVLEGKKLLSYGDKKIEINCSVVPLNYFSAHADQEELISWAAGDQAPKKIFLSHGEDNSLQELQEKIKFHLNCPSQIMEEGWTYELSDNNDKV